MTWNDIASPRLFSALFGAFAPVRPAASYEARRRRLIEEFEDGAVSDFEETRPCRWLLTEPPTLDAHEAQEHADSLR